MTTPSLSPDDVTHLIDHVLKSKDPATVGLRRILRKKESEASEFPVRTLQHEEFDVPGAAKKVLTEEERRVLELEKRVQELEIQLKSQHQNAREAVRGAYTKGLDEGIAEGRRQATSEVTAQSEKKIDAIQQRVAAVLADIEKARRGVFSDAQHVLLRFSCELARKVLNSELEQRQDIILNVVKKALTYIGDRERLLIRVAPGELEAVSGRKDFWVPVGERLKDITIEPDPRIERGGCIVESNSGVVDARLGVQFSELAELVEKVWESIVSSPVKDSTPEGDHQGA